MSEQYDTIKAALTSLDEAVATGLGELVQQEPRKVLDRLASIERRITQRYGLTRSP